MFLITFSQRFPIELKCTSSHTFEKILQFHEEQKMYSDTLSWLEIRRESANMFKILVCACAAPQRPSQ